MKSVNGEQIEKGILRTKRSKKYLKKVKVRYERRKARQNPDCIRCYRKYNGWEM